MAINAIKDLIFGNSAPVLNWQKLKSRNNKHMSELYRTAVPGGWLISQSGIGGLVFLPDPDHEWDGHSLKTNSYLDEEEDSTDN